MKVAKIYIEYEHMALNQSYLYTCEYLNIERGMRVIVNFANKDIVGFVEEVMEMNPQELESMSYTIKSVVSLLDKESLLNDELLELANYMSKKTVAPYISCLSAMLPSKLKPRSSAKPIKKEVWVVFKQERQVKTKKQSEAMEYIQQMRELSRASFNKKYKTQLTYLLSVDVVYLEEREAITAFREVYEDQAISLVDMQVQAIRQMDCDAHNVYLLHGVTGSGKTEVFLQMAQKEIDKNKQVLILVPEISLTPQMVKRVKARFKDQVAIYHSSLNNQEKYEQYQKVARNEVNIVVGTRSGVFMPFTNLGLIIMDEEHDQSYKQASTPKYHTKDMAIRRGEYHQCKVLLASATPSLESYARALKGVYTLVEMKHRIFNSMPKTSVIDMQKAMRNNENYMLSDTLKQAIKQRLDAHEQCIILLNRRGYAPILRCIDCGSIKMCPHCELALNFHKTSQRLVCHTCGYSQVSIYECESCHSKNLKYVGMGTQKLEEYIQECFSNANIVRMDADTTNTKNAHQKLLDKFEREGDILLGTQMIAKGLDYERVTLVGVVNGDVLLNRSDYRCAELTFDLLVQASGRSGRGKHAGEVYIQVYDPNHYAIQCALNHDYKSFFYQEMKFRHLANYPPYLYISSIIVSHKEESIVKREIQEIQQLLLENTEDNFRLLGPIALLKIQDMYRYRIIIKSKQETSMADALMHVYKVHNETRKKSRIEVNINPYTMD